MKLKNKYNELFYVGIGNTTKIGTIIYIENRKGYYNELFISPKVTEYKELLKNAKEYIDTIEV